VAYVRTVPTATPGARAVQIVWSSKGGSRQIEHIGSARTPDQEAALRQVARQRLHAGQDELPLLAGPASGAGRILWTSSARLWSALREAYRQVGFDRAADDPVFETLVLARVVEPTSKLDTLRLLGELGVAAPSYSTVKRRLADWSSPEWRDRLSKCCAGRAGLSGDMMLLFDVTTLYWETDRGDGFREPGYSKERRLEPQITVGLLARQDGFPLMVDAFEGDQAETKAMLPVIRAFQKAWKVGPVTVVADAGMLSEANMTGLEEAGLDFIIGGRFPKDGLPFQIQKWRREHPGEDPPDGHILVQPWPAGTKSPSRARAEFFQYKADRARRAIKSIDAQIAKAEKTVAGKLSDKHNRFVKVTGGEKTVNRALEAKARQLAGWKPYMTSLADAQPGWVIGRYHELWHVEQAFRVTKHSLRARPVYHWKQASIRAHLSIVFAALACAKLIEQRTGWSIRRVVKTLRPLHTVAVDLGGHTVLAEDPLDADTAAMLAAIGGAQDPPPPTAYPKAGPAGGTVPPGPARPAPVDTPGQDPGAPADPLPGLHTK